VLLPGALSFDWACLAPFPIACCLGSRQTHVPAVNGVWIPIALVPAVQHTAARQRTNASMAAYVHPYYPLGLDLPGVQPLVMPFEKILAIFFIACGMVLAAGWYMTGVLLSLAMVQSWLYMTCRPRVYVCVNKYWMSLYALGGP
jgi:hypothetical protein